MDLVQLKIKKDNNITKCISLIRKFDNSIPINEIKHNIENDKIVLEFDLEYFSVVEEIEGIDRKELFRNLIYDIINIGCEIKVYHNYVLESLNVLDNWISTINEIDKYD